MTDKGCEMLFTKHRAIRVIGESVKMTADHVGDLYYVHETKQEECRKVSGIL